MKRKDVVVAGVAFAAVLACYWLWKHRQTNAANPDPTNPAAAQPDFFPAAP